MQTLTDPQLLRAYAEDGSEAAFAELVRRHVDLTYTVALRIVRDTHLAEDATQAVFTALAQNASTLAGHPVLSGWLHRATRNVASQMVRSEVRRRAREQEAASMNEPSSGTDAPWEEVEPYLDAVLTELEPSDRDAVLLRYFERKTAREIADLLGIGAEAAQKRISRAVEQLRVLFARRGVVVSAGGLAVLMTSHAVQASPAGLAAAISGAATLTATASAVLPTGTAATTTATTATGTAVLFKVLTGCTLAAVTGLGIWGTMQNLALRKQVRTLEARIAATQKPAGTPLAPRIDPTRTLPLAIQGRDAFPTDGNSPLDGLTPAAPVPASGAMAPGRSAGGVLASAGGAIDGGSASSAGAGASTGSTIGSTLSPTLAATGGQALEAFTVNGNTIIRYGTLEVPIGKTRGLVTTRAISVQGREYAAAFDDGRVVWESSPGAAKRLR